MHALTDEIRNNLKYQALDHTTSHRKWAPYATVALTSQAAEAIYGSTLAHLHINNNNS